MVKISNTLINMKRLIKIKKIPLRKALFAGRWNLSLRSTNDESKYTSNNNVIKIKIYFWERKLTKLLVLPSTDQTNIYHNAKYYIDFTSLKIENRRVKSIIIR